MSDGLDPIPDVLRDAARVALSQVLGATGVTRLQLVSGGGSGALTFRVDADGRAPLLLRLESGLNAHQNPLHYACMQAAAAANIAPALHFVDRERGVALMDFVTSLPLAEYPGGSSMLVRDAGLLVRRLQDTVEFPVPGITYLDLVSRMLAFVRDANVFAPGLLDPHMAGLERICKVYPWDESCHVASHTDPNPRNWLYDGRRLWLVDWETACRNDPLLDVAVLTHELASTPELQAVLLRSWLGREPDERLRARILLMRQLTRVFFGSALLRLFAGQPDRVPDTSLQSLTRQQLMEAIRTGRLHSGMPEMLYEVGKRYLSAYASELATSGFEEALSTVG